MKLRLPSARQLLRGELSPRANYVLSALLLVATYYWFESLTHNPFEIPLNLQMLGWLAPVLLCALLYALTSRMTVALVLCELLCAAVGLLNYFVLAFRSSPILPWDILSWRTGMTVADNYDWELTPRLWLMLALLGVLAMLATRVRLRLRGARKRMLCGAGATALAFLLALALHFPSVTALIGVYEMPFTQDYVYRQNGFAISFLVNIRYLSVNPPEDYSAESVRAQLSEAVDAPIVPPAAPASAPNIIVVMNEALSDLSVIGELPVSEDPLPFLHSLRGAPNTITGDLYVSVLGGNTANTEFEFLTGNSMAFLPAGSIPYQQHVKDTVPALPAQLSALGYDTVSIHPYYESGWNRNTVYPDLGFGRSLWLPDFAGAARLRSYVTDRATYQRMEHELEQRGEAPLFLFDVTMQNHGGYSDRYRDLDMRIQVNDPAVVRQRESVYLSLVRESDDALRELIEYVSSVKEPTVVLLFGDHQPHMPDSFIERLYGKKTAELTAEARARRYITPFVLWANYDINEASDMRISANYLACLLADVTGTPKTAYQRYLSSLWHELPVVTANFCIGRNGTFYGADTRELLVPLLNGYEAAQYNALFDAEARSWEYYTP